MYNSLLQNESSLQDKTKYFIKLQIQKKQRMNAGVLSYQVQTFLRWYDLNVHSSFHSSPDWKKKYIYISLESSRPRILQTPHTFIEKLLEQWIRELSIFYWDHLFSHSTCKAQYFILLYVQYYRIHKERKITVNAFLKPLRIS